VPAFWTILCYRILQPTRGPNVPGLLCRAAKDTNTSPAGMGGGSGTLTEVANNTAFRRACADKAGLCVVVLLDPASADFERHLGEARTLAGLRAKQPVHFIWVDATSQPSFAEQFGLQPSDAPAAVALAPKKLRFRVLPGSFSASSLDKLVDAVLLGKERTQGMQVSLLQSIKHAFPQRVSYPQTTSQATSYSHSACTSCIEPVRCWRAGAARACGRRRAARIGHYGGGGGN